MIITGISHTNFKGILKPFTNRRGDYVIPISTIPSESQIDSAITSTYDNNNVCMEGYNGRAYFLGKDFVVKHYKGIEALNDDPMREIKTLDNMFEFDINFNNSQKGCYAFRTPEGEYYMVSTRVKGKNPQSGVSPFTEENLQSLVNIVMQMDKGIPVKNSSRNGFSDRCRFMNYDFSTKNMKITQKTAGVFDFEYSETENIDEIIYRTLILKMQDMNCHRSDTSPLPSSLRSFEIFALGEYLMDTDEPDSVFDDYLKIKSKYHNSMSKFYEEFSKESAFPDITKSISKKEVAHSRLLSGKNTGYIPSDIKKSEAIKIQMAIFMHEQSGFCKTGAINPNQLYDFTIDSIIYFKNNLRKANAMKDKDRQIYYTDCLELFSDWRKVNKFLALEVEQDNPRIKEKLTAENLSTLCEILNL